MNHILEALWLFLPAAIANATPVFANKVPVLNRWTTPIDFGRSFDGKRILGDNKTWRGIVFGIIIAGLAGLLQYYVWDLGDSLFFSVLVASLLGFGALYGDAAESFMKRQKAIPSGQTWFPFDQIDYILGGLVATLPLMIFGWQEVIAIIFVYFCLHLVTVYVGYRLGIRDKPI